MNAQTEKLYEQARSEIAVSHGLSDAYNGLIVARFAELIVQDCADYAAYVDGGENMFSRGIRERFGVK